MIVHVLIILLVVCIAFALAYYIINNVAPEPLRKWLNVLLYVVAGIILIMFLLSLDGVSLGSRPLLR